MGAERACRSMGTNGARRKALSTLHPNTILKLDSDIYAHPNPQDRTNGTPTPTPTLNLNPNPGLNPSPSSNPRPGSELVLGPKWRGMMWQKQP